MKIYRAVLALALISPLCGQVLKVDTDQFLRHAKTWQLPEYPQKSLNEKHTGIAVATVDVDEHGNVTRVDIDTAPDAHLAQTVKSVVSQWVFRPFMEGDRARPAESTIYIQFRLHPIGPNVMIPGLTKQLEPTIENPHRHPDQ